MSEKPTYEELERRIQELESHGHDAETIVFSQFEKHNSIVLIIDPDSGAIINANIAAEKYYGYSIKTLKQMKIQEINMLSDEEVARKRQQAAAEKQNFFEFSHRLANGEVRTVEVNSSPVTFRGRKLLLSVIHDITDRKLAEKALQEREQRFRSIVENTDAGYFFIDKNGIIQDVNKAWIDMYRFSSDEEVVGAHFTTIQKAEDTDKAIAFVNRIMSGDSSCFTGEFSRQCGDGTVGYHTFSANPVIRNNQVIGIEGFIMDTTDRRKAEEERNMLIADLKEALSEVKTLRGCLPICSHCKKIRDDKGYWNRIESYLTEHSDAEFSHGICPDCMKEHYPDMGIFDE